MTERGQRRGLLAQLRIGLRRRRPVARACPCRPATATRGTRPRPTWRGRRSSTASPMGRPSRPTSSAPARWPCWATASRPTTSAPPGSIARTSPAGEWLVAHGVEPREFNSYGSRRGHHEVMMRGTFANIRLRNALTPDAEGNWTEHLPTGERMSIFDAAMRYAEEGTPLDHPGRQGVRVRLVARLGRQGPAAPGRAGRHRRVVRADPPVQPGRDGGPAAPVPARGDRRDAGPDGTRDVRVGGLADGLRPRHGGRRDGARRRRPRDPLPRCRAAGRRDRRHLPAQRRCAADRPAPPGGRSRQAAPIAAAADAMRARLIRAAQSRDRHRGVPHDT